MSRSTDRDDALRYTISHFKEISRQNLFPENAKIAHDEARCAVCNPGIAGRDPFPFHLEVVVESILIRRPVLDEALVAQINSDREMAGMEENVTIGRLLEGDGDALDSWAAWVREALATGLGLLSVHSPTSLDFDLDEQEAVGYGPLIESKIQQIIERQKKSRG